MPGVAIQVHLVDGTYELFRYHFAPNNKDLERGATIGVVRSLLELVAAGATHVGVATDHVIESFRNDLFAGYKTSDGVPDDLLAQFEPAERACRAMGMVVWPMVEFEADDALAAVSLLRGEPSIDPDRVGLTGMSQGGWIIARAAIRSDDVAFVVALSPSGFAPAVAADWLTGSMLAVRGFDERAIDASARLWGMMYSSLDLIEAGLMEPMPSVPGFWFHALDPHLETVSLWEQVRQPVLALWGELDCQVPAHDSLAAMRGALERGPNRVHELRILPEADHGLALVGACEREIGFSHGGRHHYADGALTAPAEWIGSLPTKADGGTVVVPDQRTPSVLGWHQSTSAGVAWYGSLVPQVMILPVLLILFGSTGGAWVVRGVIDAIRPRRERRPASAHLWGITGLVGVLATLAGYLALVERLNELELYLDSDPKTIRGFRTVLVTESDHPFVKAWWPPGHVIGYEHTFVHQVADFLECLAKGEPCQPDFKNAQQTQLVLDAILDYLPSPLDEREWEGKHPLTGETETRRHDPNAPFSAYVFKTIIDPFAGKAAGRLSLEPQDTLSLLQSQVVDAEIEHALALAHLEGPHGALGTEVEMEITVEHHRRRAAARVVKTPFFDPPRKRA